MDRSDNTGKLGLPAPVTDALSLPDYLPYKLSIASNRVSGLIARAYQSRFGLSVWEWRVLAVLGHGKSLSAQEICEATAMDKVMVSRAIRNLHDRELVQRKPRQDDRRAADITLTKEGQRIYTEVVPLALEYETALMEGISSQDRETLKALLEKLETRAGELLDDSADLTRQS